MTSHLSLGPSPIDDALSALGELLEAAGTPFEIVVHAAGFGKRNVADALGALASAGVVGRLSRGNEHRFAIDAARWSGLLQVAADELPRAVDRVGLLPAV